MYASNWRQKKEEVHHPPVNGEVGFHSTLSKGRLAKDRAGAFRTMWK